MNDLLEALEKYKNQAINNHDNYIAEDLQEAINLIERQKAEIERLKNECFCLANERDAYKDVLDTAVTEARKEFAERLQSKFAENTHLRAIAFQAAIYDMHNLVKEMESERE